MAESIGNLYPTQIPSLSETADIQEAFRLYHYGAPSGTGSGEYDPTNSNVANLINPSIAYTLNNLQSQITTISGSLGVQATVWTTKGDLVTRTSSPGVIRFGVGADGTVLTANSSTATGLDWAALPVTLTNAVTLSGKTISGLNNTITNIGNASLVNSSITVGSTSISLGATATTVAGLTLTSPVISTISNTGTLTLPTSTDTLVGRATTDTLTNKTLTSPVISTISNTGTLTLPTSTDTLVGRATTDTLTNKTLTSPVINVASQTTYSGTPNTLVLTDNGKIVFVSHTTFTTLSIPTNASVAFPIGTQILVIQTGLGQVTLAAVNAGITTINATPGLKLRAQRSGAVLIKTGTDTWYVIGDLAA